MTETDRFLSEYKRFESALRETGTADSVLDYENACAGNTPDNTDKIKASSDDADKIKTCRIIRNYIQHHADGAKMFPASAEMTRYIKGLADRTESKLKHIKDIMKRQKAVTFSTTIKDTVEALKKTKLGYVAVTDDNGDYTGVLSNAALIWIIAEKMSLAGKLGNHIDKDWLTSYMKGLDVAVLSPDDRAEKAYEGAHGLIIVCKDGKYKGMIRTE